MEHHCALIRIIRFGSMCLELWHLFQAYSRTQAPASGNGAPHSSPGCDRWIWPSLLHDGGGGARLIRELPWTPVISNIPLCQLVHINVILKSSLSFPAFNPRSLRIDAVDDYRFCYFDGKSLGRAGAEP